jgi:hypothetical protein
VNGVQLITQAEYARRRGCAKSAVAKAVAEKRISLIDGKIDPEVADIQWERNTRARADSRPSAATNAVAPAQAPIPAADAPAAPDSLDRPAAATVTYADARAKREQAEAETAQLRAAKEAGRLVERDRVERAVFEAFRAMRDRVMQVPGSCAPLVIGLVEVREVEQLFADELRKALGGFEASAIDTMKARISG